MFRDHALQLVGELARRYGSHPAVKLWHVSNELGCHVVRCYCDVSAAAFRRWLVGRYGSVDKLNEAWGTAFWSQRYSSFDEVLPPRLTPTFTNPGHELDFSRFSSDALLDHYRVRMTVFPSAGPETFSYTLTESFAARRPALVPPIGALAERVRASCGGWLMDDWEDDEAILKQLLLLLSPAAAEHFARAADCAGRPLTPGCAGTRRTGATVRGW